MGDVVSVEMEFDNEYQSGPAHPMPSPFSAALRQNSAAKQRWGKLTPSLQKEVLRYFFRLKSSEAKERNLQRAIDVLSGGKGRFLGRTWNP